eukprot:9649084-Heterocapsa_arctica.AAC.1
MPVFSVSSSGTCRRPGEAPGASSCDYSREIMSPIAVTDAVRDGAKVAAAMIQVKSAGASSCRSRGGEEGRCEVGASTSRAPCRGRSWGLMGI